MLVIQGTIPDMEKMIPGLTPWHITFGTYGARLHGGERRSVIRDKRSKTTTIIARDPDLEDLNRGQMRGAPVLLTHEQRAYIQQTIPALCQRGNWRLRCCAAASDHVHALLDIDPSVHGEKVRRLLKRWLTQALDQRWQRPPGGSWWAEQGSNKAIHDDAYLTNAYAYIAKQRAK